jgi:hypothetical protein
MGLEVELVRGIRGSVEADLWLPNVDLTVLPTDYQRFLDSCPRVVNRAVIDISKRRISKLIVRPGDGYRGPVIVKSNANYGGRPERRLLGDDRDALRRPWRESIDRLRRRLGLVVPFDPSAPIDPRYYPIFQTRDQLPEGIFQAREFVVERFVPEQCGRLYVLRSCGIACNETFNVRMTSKQPVVKAGDIVDREELPAPRAIIDIASRFFLDFGKLDYVVHRGDVHLFDLNRTPMFRRFRGRYDDEQRGIAMRFARALIERFERPDPRSHNERVTPARPVDSNRACNVMGVD